MYRSFKKIVALKLKIGRAIALPCWKGCRKLREKRALDLLSDKRVIEKTLGLQWDTVTDSISFALNWNKVHKDIAEGHKKPTKREMLRILMSIFDPLGILLPFTIRGKILLQRVWRSGIGWDDKLKDVEFSAWTVWILALRRVNCYSISRAYSLSRSSQRNFELHFFCDASDKAYTAVEYLRTSDERNNMNISLVAGKAKVARY